MVQEWRPVIEILPRGVKRVTELWQLPSVPDEQVVLLPTATASVVALPVLPQVAAP
jgi:hypothetical protein